MLARRGESWRKSGFTGRVQGLRASGHAQLGRLASSSDHISCIWRVGFLEMYLTRQRSRRRDTCRQSSKRQPHGYRLEGNERPLLHLIRFCDGPYQTSGLDWPVWPPTACVVSRVESLKTAGLTEAVGSDQRIFWLMGVLQRNLGWDSPKTRVGSRDPIAPHTCGHALWSARSIFPTFRTQSGPCD